MLTNKMHFLNWRFNSIVLVFYTLRTSYVHHREDHIVSKVELITKHRIVFCEFIEFIDFDLLQKSDK